MFVGLARRDQLGKTLSATIIVKPEAFENGGDSIKEPMDRHMMPRLRKTDSRGFTDSGADMPVFVASDDGQLLYQGSRTFLFDYGRLQCVGSFAGIDADLREKDSFRLEAASRHHQVAASLINCPRGGTVIETGAGGAYDRIKCLSDSAHGNGGRLICHDLTPAAAHAAREAISGIPFLALPHHARILAPAIKAAKGPKVFSMQNVFSSMSFSCINELTALLKEVDAKKMVVSQSLAFVRDTTLIPDGFGPGQPGFEAYMGGGIMDQCFEYILDKVGSQEGRLLVSGTFLEQVEHVFYQLIMEIAKYYLMSQLEKKSGLKGAEQFLVGESVVVEADEAGDFISRYRLDIAEGFFEGNYNCVAIGPFGVRLSKEPNVAAGCLKVRSLQMDMVFTKFINSKPYDLPNFEGQEIVSSRLQLFEPIVPRQFRAHDRLLAVLRQNHGIQIHGGVQSLAVDGGSDAEFMQGSLLGAEVAFNFLFKYLMGHGVPTLAKLPERYIDMLRREYVEIYR